MSELGQKLLHAAKEAARVEWENTEWECSRCQFVNDFRLAKGLRNTCWCDECGQRVVFNDALTSSEPSTQQRAGE